MLRWFLVIAVLAAASATATALLLLQRRRGAAAVALTAVVALAVTAAAVTAAPIAGAARNTSEDRAAAVAGAASPSEFEVAPAARWRATVSYRDLAYARIPRLRIPVFPAALRASTSRNPVVLPSRGLVGTVVIPATRSHFSTRPAVVYLPPAARVPQPRLLPVVVAFSGQSRGAGPYDLVWSADIGKLMDRIAAEHHGVAPIVVVPDQLGSDTGNPMCVDSKLGHVATYVMQDVRRWIVAHLPVETDRQDWTVAGFSEGGTCAIQFAAAHPDAFGSFVDVSGESAPADGSVAHSIAAGFRGSRIAYEHASPTWILAHHRYRDEQAFFAAGALDRVYGPVMPVLARRAGAAGMMTHEHVVPGLSHNWRMAVRALVWGFDHLVGRWGI